MQKETEKRMQEEAEKQKLLEELKGKENITPDGRKTVSYTHLVTRFMEALTIHNRNCLCGLVSLFLYSVLEKRVQTG